MLRNALILIITIALGAGLTYWLDNGSALTHASLSPEKAPQIAVAGKVAPDFSFVTLAGAEMKISDLRGKIIVLNFWASWCAPCLKEFPLFLDLAAENPDDIIFLALSSDHDEKAMQRFIEKMRKEKPTAMSGGNVLLSLDTGGAVTRGIFQTFRLPETIIIDRDGFMREKLVGADWSYEDLNGIIKNIDNM